MPYRLTMDRSPGAGLRDAALEQLTTARDGLAQAGEAERPQAVHAARKSLKKTRSLLRLARPALGEQRYRAANDALRQTGLTLSGTRDADVLVATVARLHERHPGQLPAAGFQALADAVAAAARETAAASAPPGGADPVVVAGAQLDAVLDGVADWPLEAAGWGTVRAGLRRSYARGRAAQAAVTAAPTAEARHAWRKRVKDLWYQQRLVTAAWEPVLAAQAEEAHALSELLGDDHDLAVLREHVASGRADVGADTDAVLALVDAGRAELLEAALALGARVYAETPRAFGRRTKAYLRAWARTPDGVATGA